jgi:hypothetical protein
MTETPPARAFLLPRLTALVEEAVAAGFEREVAVAVLIDLVTAPPFNTIGVDPLADSEPHAGYERSPDDPVLVAGHLTGGPPAIGAQGEDDFTRNPTWRE